MTEKVMQRAMDSAVESLMMGRTDMMADAVESVVEWFNNTTVELVKERYRALLLVAKNTPQQQRPEAIAVMVVVCSQLVKRHGGDELLDGLQTYLYAFYHRQKTVNCMYPEQCFTLFVDGFDVLNDLKKLTYPDISFLLEVKNDINSKLNPVDRAVHGKMRFLMIDCAMMVNRLNKVLATG